MPTSRTYETIGPARLNQKSQTRLFRREEPLKLENCLGKVWTWHLLCLQSGHFQISQIATIVFDEIVTTSQSLFTFYDA